RSKKYVKLNNGDRISASGKEAPVEKTPYQQKDGALLIVGTLCDKLKQTEPYKSELESMLVQSLEIYIVHFGNLQEFRYHEAPVEIKPYRQKHDALLAIGTLCDKLKQTEKYKYELESMLVQHVFPEFNSPVGHIKAKDKLLNVVFEETLVEPNMLVVDVEKFVSPEPETWFLMDAKDPVGNALVEIVEGSDMKPSDITPNMLVVDVEKFVSLETFSHMNHLIFSKNLAPIMAGWRAIVSTFGLMEETNFKNVCRR
ncbi:hypothetical protein Tco_0110439, partial [Tanacetum coccineum]